MRPRTLSTVLLSTRPEVTIPIMERTRLDQAIQVLEPPPMKAPLAPRPSPPMYRSSLACSLSPVSWSLFFKPYLSWFISFPHDPWPVPVSVSKGVDIFSAAHLVRLFFTRKDAPLFLCTPYVLHPIPGKFNLMNRGITRD